MLPDSPVSLIERGHLEKARKVLSRVRGVEDVDEEFQDIVEAARVANMVKRPWRNIVRSQYRCAWACLVGSVPWHQNHYHNHHALCCDGHWMQLCGLRPAAPGSHGCLSARCTCCMPQQLHSSTACMLAASPCFWPSRVALQSGADVAHWHAAHRT